MRIIRRAQTQARHHAQPAKQRLGVGELVVCIQPEGAVLGQRALAAVGAPQEADRVRVGVEKAAVPQRQVRDVEGRIGQAFGGVEKIVELRAAHQRGDERRLAVGDGEDVVRVGIAREFPLVKILEQVAVAELVGVHLDVKVVGEELRALQCEAVTVGIDGQTGERGAIEVGVIVVREVAEELEALVAADLPRKRAIQQTKLVPRRQTDWSRRHLIR